MEQIFQPKIIFSIILCRPNGTFTVCASRVTPEEADQMILDILARGNKIIHADEYPDNETSTALIFKKYKQFVFKNVTKINKRFHNNVGLVRKKEVREMELLRYATG